MCIDVGFGHEQREHFELVCTYPASVKVEWCGQAAGMYLLTARSLTDQLVSLIGFWSRLCSLAPEVLRMSLILTGPQECLGDYPSGRLGKLEPSFRLFASVGMQDSQREGLWFWQL